MFLARARETHTYPHAQREKLASEQNSGTNSIKSKVQLVSELSTQFERNIGTCGHKLFNLFETGSGFFVDKGENDP